MLNPRKKNGLKEFYFSTNTSSMRVNQYKSNPNASIYFYHKGLIKYVGVMLKGKMEILTDHYFLHEIKLDFKWLWFFMLTISYWK